MEHKITLTDQTPVNQSPQALDYKVQQEVQTLLDPGLIQWQTYTKGIT